MAALSKYRLYCETEEQYIYVWTENEPTLCPNNSGHSINSDIVIVEQGVASPAYSRYIMLAGENVSASKAVYISASNEVKLAKADSEATLPCVGFTEDSATISGAVGVTTNDVLGGFSGLTPGAAYYVSQDTAGEITSTKPSSGIIISVGAAKTSEELDIHIYRQSAETASGTSSKSLAVVINGYSGEAYKASSSDTYEVATYFIFPGSNDAGIPTAVKAVAIINTAPAFDIKIHDYTNNTDIAEVIGSTNDNAGNLVDLGTLSNIPTDPAMWEVHIRRNGGSGSKTVWIAAVSVLW